jgi:hypothetical protein
MGRVGADIIDLTDIPAFEARDKMGDASPSRQYRPVSALRNGSPESVRDIAECHRQRGRATSSVRVRWYATRRSTTSERALRVPTGLTRHRV